METRSLEQGSAGNRQHVGRRAHAAIERLSQASQDGYRWGVDCDLKSYFDMVNHDLLMHRLGKRVRDKSVPALVGKYLRAGVRHDDGRTEIQTSDTGRSEAEMEHRQVARRVAKPSNGTAVIRTRMSGGVGAGRVNAPGYPIGVAI